MIPLPVREARNVTADPVTTLVTTLVHGSLLVWVGLRTHSYQTFTVTQIHEPRNLTRERHW